jgi:hypothetical protein
MKVIQLRYRRHGFRTKGMRENYFYKYELVKTLKQDKAVLTAWP